MNYNFTRVMGIEITEGQQVLRKTTKLNQTGSETHKSVGCGPERRRHIGVYAKPAGESWILLTDNS